MINRRPPDAISIHDNLIASMIFCFRVALLLLIFSLSTVTLDAQKPFSEIVDVTVVNVFVTAVDSRGAFVSDLRQDELILKEDGVEQIVTHFGSGEREIPLNVAVIIDNSASMGSSHLDLAKRGAIRFLDELQPEDSVFLITFRQKAFITVEATTDKTRVRDALGSLQVQYGSTALFDTVKMAVEKLKPEPGRKVLVLFSDGQDTVSEARSPQDNPVSRFAGISDIMTISFGTVLNPSALRWYNAQKEYDQGKKTLENLSSITGGFSFFPKSLNDVEKAIASVQGALRNQYALSYQPSNRVIDGEWRTIEVACKRKGVTLNYRKGYYALASQG